MGVFTIDLSGLGQAVSDSMTSLAPLFFIVAGLVVAAGALSWGIDMLRSWQEDRADYAALREDIDAGYVGEDLVITEKGMSRYD